MRTLACFGLAALLWACGGEDFSSGSEKADAAVGGASGTGATTGGSAGQTGGAGGASGGSSGGSSGSSSGGASGSGAVGGSAGSCAGQCLSIPKDWTGPVQRLIGSSCGGSYPKELLSLGNGLQQAGCEPCSCSGNCRIGVQVYTQAGCNGPPKSTEVVGGACKPLVQTGVLSMQVSPVAAACAPDKPNPAPLPVTWKDSVKVCGTSQTASCGDAKVCVSDANSACVYRTGNYPCPSGWDEKHVDYENINDTRSCSPCSCKRNSGGCVVTGELYVGASCSVGSTASCNSKSGGPDCCDLGATASDLTSGYVKSHNIGCTKSGGALSGSASPKDSYTVCCR